MTALSFRPSESWENPPAQQGGASTGEAATRGWAMPVERRADPWRGSGRLELDIRIRLDLELRCACVLGYVKRQYGDPQAAGTVDGIGLTPSLDDQSFRPQILQVEETHSSGRGCK